MLAKSCCQYNTGGPYKYQWVLFSLRYFADTILPKSSSTLFTNSWFSLYILCFKSLSFLVHLIFFLVEQKVLTESYMVSTTEQQDFILSSEEQSKSSLLESYLSRHKDRLPSPLSFGNTKSISENTYISR